MDTKKSILTESPQVIEKEKFVLGSMLLKDGEVVPDVAAILSADDFYRPEHRLIFNAIINLYAKEKVVNILNLTENLRAATDQQGYPLLDKIGIDYILGLGEIAHTTAYSVSYSNDIKNSSNNRKLILRAQKIIDDARAGLKSPLDIIAETTDDFYNLDNPDQNKFVQIGKHLATDFFREIEQNKVNRQRKTGFYNIDQHQKFLPGLYVIGATPAAGKTTFVWQLLDQLADAEENCIFCSYEMEKNSLIAKTLARRLFINNPNATLTAADILDGGFTNAIVDIQNQLFKRDNFIVREFSANEPIDKLLAILRPIVKSFDSPYEKKPIICIDYLQRIIDRNSKNDMRFLIDDALFKLKDFSKKTGVTFIVVSTFNRTNYNVPVSFESFKESGGIEYTADVVWALQLNISNKLSGENVGVIRQKIDAAKRQQPREIQIHCLKNRFGNNYDCYFHYFSAHDYFKPCEEFDFIHNINGDGQTHPEGKITPDKQSNTDENDEY
jgi:replicative DNA helicase